MRGSRLRSWATINRLTATELQSTLPLGWTSTGTNQYHYRFLFEDETTDSTTWTHPNPMADPSLWQPFPESPPLGYQPAYEALSYVWGPKSHTDVIYIVENDDNIQSSAETLTIRQNLAQALRYLRYERMSRTLWIDAICINQNIWLSAASKSSLSLKLIAGHGESSFGWARRLKTADLLSQLCHIWKPTGDQ